MSFAFNRTIESPGVEIRELDLTLNVGLPVGTNVLVSGFAEQGPTDELINITSLMEFEQIFGEPNNSAERYFYHTCRQVLLKNGNLIAARLPYGEDLGDGYGSEHSALVYPVYAEHIISTFMSGSETFAVDPSANEIQYLTHSDQICSMSIDEFNQLKIGGDGELTFNIDLTGAGVTDTVTSNHTLSSIKAFLTKNSTADNFYIGEPTQLKLTEWEYSQLEQGQIAWKNWGGIAHLNDNCFTFDNIGEAGMVVLNKVKKTTNDQREGFYVVLADNTKIGYGTDYNVIQGIKTVTHDYEARCGWFDVNPSVLNFELTGAYLQSNGSMSEVVESLPSFDISGPEFNDTILLGVVKLRVSPFAASSDNRPFALDQVLIETHLGSFDSERQIQNRNGGPMQNFYLEDIVNETSNNIQLLINPWISKRSTSWTDDNGNLVKSVRVYSEVLESDMSGNWYPAQPYDYSTEGSYISSVVHEVHDGGNSVAVTSGAHGAQIAFSQFKDGDKEFEFGYGNRAFALGLFTSRSSTEIKKIGSVNDKILRILRLAENVDEIPLDIICEAGLGTINTYTKVAEMLSFEGQTKPTNPYQKRLFDMFEDWQGDFRDDLYLPTVFEELEGIRRLRINAQMDTELGNIHNVAGRLIHQDYSANTPIHNGKDSYVANTFQSTQKIFETFCEFTRRPGTLFISDPLRAVFVQGQTPTLACRDEDGNRYNFPQHIYWGLRNLYSGSNTSYSCTYGNWVKSYDAASDHLVWLPFSGFAAGIMCDVDRNFFPWFAPAGLNRGRITDVVQLAFNPTQKQRDLLYRHSINPLAFFPQDGYVVWGQKTLYKKPSAFDRINVRRLFLVLQKATVAAARYFVFEPNTIFTRSRVADTLSPIFERAKNNEGLYDYLIVCDERNNTPDVIDRNEMVIDIYLKPVRAAEFILISFIATRTGQDFSELI